MNKFLWLCCLCLPLRHMQLTSAYGYRVHPVTGRFSFHAGIDLRAHGDTVFAVLPGVIAATSYNALLGVNIRLSQGDFETIYGHLSQIFVLPGDSVDCATPLGITGSSGRVTGEHLHFSVLYHGTPVDPLRFLNILSLNNKENNK